MKIVIIEKPKIKLITQDETSPLTETETTTKPPLIEIED